MPIMMIAYDLAIGSEAEAAISTAVRGLGQRFARPLAALWYIETTASVADIEACLSPLIGDEDGLVVQEVTQDGVGRAALSNTMFRWTCGSRPPRAHAGGRYRTWQPRLVPTELMPAGGHLPVSETEVAAAA